jgi:predicted nucleic acid-binding protein
MIFIDSNIPMYLVGAEHPLKRSAERMLDSAIIAGTRLVTDAEVFQEILHRYTAIHRLDAISPAFELLSSVVDEVIAVTFEDTLRARDLLLAGPHRLSARDALHIAVMERSQVKEIMTFDAGFANVSQIALVKP